MLNSLLSIDELMNDLRPICSHAGLNTNDDNVVRQFGIECTADLQQAPVTLRLDGPNLTFGRPEISDRLVTFNVFTSENLREAVEFSDEQTGRISETFQKSVQLLDRLPQNVGTLFRTVIREVAVFNLPRPEAGSHSSMIGLAYVNPSSDWSVEYFAKVLVQEMVHSIINIRDMARGMMPDMELLRRGENGCFSATSQMMRPFDEAFHAACAMAAILWLNQELVNCGKPHLGIDVDEVVYRGKYAVQELKNVTHRNSVVNRPILTASGWELLTELSAFFHDSAFERCSTHRHSNAASLVA